MEFININGEIESLTMVEIKRRSGKGVSWEQMNKINKHQVTYKNKKYVDFLKRYGLKLTIFNFNNIVEWGYLQLYSHFVEIALKNGAVDLRGKELDLKSEVKGGISEK